MTSRKIAVDLRNRKYFQREQVAKGAISSAYSQTQEADQPKVLYESNTLPLENGIRAATLFDDLVGFILSEDINTDAALDAALITDIHGNQGAALFEMGNSFFRDYNIYIRPQHYSGALLKYISYQKQEENFFNKRHTLFQNRTIILSGLGDTYHRPISNDSTVSPRNGVLEVDMYNELLINHNLSGITLNGLGIQGIASYQNYLVLFNRTTLYWSNPLDFTDFTPAVGGGGSSKISEARGDIITVQPSTNGLFIYCRNNIIHAAYSGDAANPWIFREVPNSTGVYISNDFSGARPLVNINEQTHTQVALLEEGLHIVTENSCQPLPSSINRYVNGSFIEQKAQGSNQVTRYYTSNEKARVPHVQGIYFYGSLLMITLGDQTTTSNPEQDRLLVIDLKNETYGTIIGRYRAVMPRVTYAEALEGDEAIHRKPKIIPDSFLLLERAALEPNRLSALVLDLGGAGDVDVSSDLYPSVPSEVLIGPVTISRDRTTILHSVKLHGYKNKEKNLINDELLKVFAFSDDTLGKDNPMEFVYNPSDDTYYGYVEGKEITVLLQGYYFYLTDCELTVEDGGEF